ncbi:thiamine diphosphokinase [Lacticaseibacillus daqingensis]|uniref:thiamine diphosphokinase n=1 Tax=Lacticaseibacillus daqingensis TaxID=2486014 RepID=UPI000F79F8E4|nr:thiamine diphosphokinase [Lacticaseibacillus daqingensis]
MGPLNLMVGGPNVALPAQWSALDGAWVGVDRGSLRLLNAGVTPVFVVGDFDSLTPAERARVFGAVATVHTAPAEKDETDTEMAVRLAFEAGASRVRLVGATGGRLDHLLSNLFLPTQPRFATVTERIELLDAQNRVRFYQPGTHHLTPDTAYRYLGVVPLTAVSHLSIRGAKYPLADWSSTTPFSWASNEFVAGTAVTLTWTRGVVAVIESRDRIGQTRDN